MAEKLYFKQGEFVPDNLIAGVTIDILTNEVVLEKGQGPVKRGTVIGLVTATKLGRPVDSSQSDGTEVPYCILVDDVDTGDGSETDHQRTSGYFTGLFNKAALIFGGTDTADTHKAKLRDMGIFLKDNMAY